MSFKNIFNVPKDIYKSESLKSYLILNPKGPYFLRYCNKAWKNVSEYKHCNHYFLLFGQLFITSSDNYLNDREMFGLMPLGGSRVNLLAF